MADKSKTEAKSIVCPGQREKKCGTIIKDSDNAIECDICAVWHHIKCQKLTIKAYTAISDHRLFWVCDCCKLKYLQIQDTLFTTILDKLEKIEDKVCQVSVDLNTSQNKISKSYADATKSIEELTAVTSPTNLEGNDNLKSTKLLVKEVIHQKYDQENREQNVIVYNCPESHNDVDSFIKLVQSECEVKIGKKDVDEARRIGIANEAKTRPLLVRLKNVDLKKDIMKGLHKLKTNNPGVYINHDCSKEERDHFNETRVKQK